MAFRSISAFLIVLAIGATACAQSKAAPKPPPAPAATAEVDAQACAAQGGVVRKVCMRGIPRCVVPYSDAGKQCRDSDECQGRCLIDGKAGQVGAPAVGYCQKEDDPCGCFTTVEDGKISSGLCVD